jgi:hypothetical protein
MKTSLLLIATITLALTACNNGAKTDNIKSRENGSADETILNPKFDPNKIHGLGIFKIGVSIDSSIGKLLKEQKYEYDSICTGDQVIQSTVFLAPRYSVNIIKPSNNPIDFEMMESAYGFGLLNEKVKVYFLDAYMVDSLNIYNMVAKYYDNKLVYLKCKFEMELEDALLKKYGTGETMRNDPGRDMKDDWHQYKNGDLTALYGYQQFTSDNGKPQILKIFVKDAPAFFREIGKNEYATLDSAYKAQKNNGLKNL